MGLESIAGASVLLAETPQEPRLTVAFGGNSSFESAIGLILTRGVRRLVLLGTGVWNDPAAVNSLSREGDPRESEVGSVESEVGSMEAEAGSKEAKVGSVEAEVGSMEAEAGPVESEVWSLEAEAGSWEVEDGCMEAEAGSMEAEAGELLRGPLYYVLIMSTCTAVFWRNSVPGMAALALMCGGDGWTVLRVELRFVAYFDALGYISHGVIDSAPGIIAVSLAATLVESLPVNRFFDDNFSVPLVASVVGMLVFST
eukprot:gene4481-5493_t